MRLILNVMSRIEICRRQFPPHWNFLDGTRPVIRVIATAIQVLFPHCIRESLPEWM